MSVFSPRKSKNNHSDTPPSCTHNSSVSMDPNDTSQVLMDVDDPPVSLLQSLNHADLHPESNTVEMEAAWTNCGRRPQVKDVSDDDSNSDSDSSELVTWIRVRAMKLKRNSPAQLLDNLNNADYADICTFNYYINNGLTRDAYESLHHAFPKHLRNLRSLFKV